MVNYKYLGYGNILFFLGWFLTIVINYIAEALINALITSATLKGIIWFGIAVLYFLALIVVPIGFIVIGLIQTEVGHNKMFDAVFGVTYGLFTMAFAFFTWYMVPTFVNMMPEAFLAILFWIGLLVLYMTNVIVVPAYTIIKAKQ